MSLLTSDRERRLWLWTLAVMVAIYATLGPARTLVDALRERNLLRVSFAVVVFLILLVIVRQWVRKRPSWSETGVALGVALAYWATFLRIENPAERTHLIEYGIVASLIHMALLERVRNGRLVRWPAALAVVVTALLGLLDEGIQAVLPSRVFDWNDVFFNALAGFMVIVARLALAPVQRPGWRLWFLWFMTGAIGWGVSMDVSTFGEGRRFELLQSIPPIMVPQYMSVAAGGILVGVFHWLVLRRYVTGSFGWVYASLGGAAAGALIFFGVGLFDADLGWIAGAGLYGTLVGLMQWRVLRRQVARSGWWVLASTVGWIVAFPLGELGGPPGWAVYGAITGTMLVWLLRQETPDAEPHQRSL